jgi:hypothetical protein
VLNEIRDSLPYTFPFPFPSSPVSQRNAHLQLLLSHRQWVATESAKLDVANGPNLSTRQHETAAMLEPIVSMLIELANRLDID